MAAAEADSEDEEGGRRGKKGQGQKERAKAGGKEGKGKEGGKGKESKAQCAQREAAEAARRAELEMLLMDEAALAKGGLPLKNVCFFLSLPSPVPVVRLPEAGGWPRTGGAGFILPGGGGLV